MQTIIKRSDSINKTNIYKLKELIQNKIDFGKSYHERNKGMIMRNMLNTFDGDIILNEDDIKFLVGYDRI